MTATYENPDSLAVDRHRSVQIQFQFRKRGLPFELLCSRCGHAVYSSDELKSPVEILKPFRNRCKHCGVMLVADSFKVEVERFDGVLTHKDGDIKRLSPLPLAETRAVT